MLPAAETRIGNLGFSFRSPKKYFCGNQNFSKLNLPEIKGMSLNYFPYYYYYSQSYG